MENNLFANYETTAKEDKESSLFEKIKEVRSKMEMRDTKAEAMPFETENELPKLQKSFGQAILTCRSSRTPIV